MAKFFYKSPFQAVLFSMLLHVLVGAVFLLIKMHSEPVKNVEIFIQLPKVEPQPVIVPVQQQKPEPVAEKVLPDIALPEHVDELPMQEDVFQVDSVRTDSVEKFNRTTFFTQAPQLAYKQPLEDLKTDSLDILAMAPTSGSLFADFNDSTQFNVAPGPAADRVNRDLYRKNVGHAPTVPLGQALGEGAKYLSDFFNKKKDKKPVRLDFIPSKVELDVLQTIWQTSSATDVDIYASMDSTIRITAVDMTVVLEKLEEKGLVKRELISPQHLFSFPLGQVEMSMKNRRNRVYRYETRINADEVIRYLQAVLYETEYGQSGASDSTRSKQADHLREKILRLMEDKG